MTLSAAIITSAAKAVGVEAALLVSMCFVETRHINLLTINDGGSPSYGVCQVKLPTARMFRPSIRAHELMNVYTNAKMAALYLKYQMRRYGSVELAVAAYNSGSVNIDKPLKPHQTRYVTKVERALKEQPWVKKKRKSCELETKSCQK